MKGYHKAGEQFSSLMKIYRRQQSGAALIIYTGCNGAFICSNTEQNRDGWWEFESITFWQEYAFIM